MWEKMGNLMSKHTHMPVFIEGEKDITPTTITLKVLGYLVMQMKLAKLEYLQATPKYLHAKDLADQRNKLYEEIYTIADQIDAQMKARHDYEIQSQIAIEMRQKHGLPEDLGSWSAQAVLEWNEKVVRAGGDSMKRGVIDD
jgi:hypothetical protein